MAPGSTRSPDTKDFDNAGDGDATLTGRNFVSKNDHSLVIFGFAEKLIGPSALTAHLKLLSAIVACERALH